MNAESDPIQEVKSMVSINGILKPTMFNFQVVDSWAALTKGCRIVFIDTDSDAMLELLKHMSMWKGPSTNVVKSQGDKIYGWEFSAENLKWLAKLCEVTKDYRSKDLHTVYGLSL